MNRIQARGGAIGFKMQGFFRLVVANASLQDELRRAHPDWPREKILKICGSYDSGWIPNVVTDHGRKYLHNNAWGTLLNMFIHESAAVANVRRTSLQFSYASQTPSQVRVTDGPAVLDLTTLLQTRTVQFPAPSVTRTINTVGLTNTTAGSGDLVGERALHAILAYTKLTTTVIQDTLSTADLQYRVSWSLN